MFEVAAQRQLAGESSRLDAGHGANGFERPIEELMDGGGLHEPPAGRLYLHRQQMRSVESWRDGEQPLHAAEQQACADQQHERQRNLGDDEEAARHLMTARGLP